MHRRLIQSVIRQAELSAYQEQYRSQSDADLFRAYRENDDHVAFAGLVRRHGPMVWNVCRNLLRSEANAEDAFQATFLALVRTKKAIRNPAALGGWLHRVSVQVCRRALRDTSRRARRERAAAIPETAKTAATPDREWRELHERVHREIDQLPDGQRSVFVLCCLEGMRPVDAARRLGLKVNTLTSLLTRARQRMLNRLRDCGQLAGMLAGIAVLAESPSLFAVPGSLFEKVVSFAQSDVAAEVPSIVLNLAHAATEVPLLRYKMLAAIFLVGVTLTAGMGGKVLSHSYADDPNPSASKTSSSTGDPSRSDRLTQFQSKQDFGKGQAKSAIMDKRKTGDAGGANTVEPSDPFQGMKKPATQTETMAWEYEVIVLRDRKELTKWGDEGWELAAIDRGQNSAANAPMAYLKRRKASAAVSTAPKAEANSNLPGITRMNEPAKAETILSGLTPLNEPAKSTTKSASMDVLKVVALKQSQASEMSSIVKELFGKNPGFRESAVDHRTNSLILYGSDEVLDTIQALLSRLDQEKPLETKRDLPRTK